MKSLRAGAVALLSVWACSAFGQGPDIDKAMATLAENLSAQTAKAGKKKVTVLDFIDLQGNATELGRFLAEQLSVSLVERRAGFSVVDRASLRPLLEQHHLTLQGLVEPANAKKLGDASGVDAVVLGGVSVLKEEVALTIKLIATDTAETVGATRLRIPRTKDIDLLLGSALPDDVKSPPRLVAAPAQSPPQTTPPAAGSLLETNLGYALRIDVNAQQRGDILAKVESIRLTTQGQDRFASVTIFLVNRNASLERCVMVRHPGYDYTYATLTDGEGRIVKIDASGVNRGQITGVKHDYNNANFTPIEPNTSAKMVLHFPTNDLKGGLKPPFRVEFVLGQADTVSAHSWRELSYLIETTSG